MRRVYLAGPPFAEEYRRRAASLLAECGLEPVDPMRRDFRARPEATEAEIVDGAPGETAPGAAVLADSPRPDEGTAMEAWHAHALGKPVIVYTGGTPPHPWTVYVADSVHADLADA